MKTFIISLNNPKMEKNWNQYFFNFILRNMDKPWNWGVLSMNPSITWEIVEENPDKPWNWYWLSENPSITWENIEANPDKPWNWNGFSRNPSITWEMVEANSDKPWNLYYLSQNPSSGKYIRGTSESIYASEANRDVATYGIRNRRTR